MGSKLTRRGFVGQIGVLSGGLAAAGVSCGNAEAPGGHQAAQTSEPGGGETLYNGIRLPAQWPPRPDCRDSRTPRLPPYLKDVPEVIPIDLGRQLFVDDFLIQETTLARTYHRATLHEANPVLEPETELEMNDGVRPLACPFDDGVFYDPQDRLFKIWYHAGWYDAVAYATSRDGIRWQRPRLDVVPGTNRVLAPRPGITRDGVGIWLDHETTDPEARFKMFVYLEGKGDDHGEIFTSPDGLHWSTGKRTGPCGDNTTFYNPFRKVWVYSIRSNELSLCSPTIGRLRSYYEHADFLTSADEWEAQDISFWCGADELDLPDPELGYPTQLYNVDAAPYESLMLGLLAIWRGPPNGVCQEKGIPKITELCLAYSRDGFHWYRPEDRRPFIAASRQEGAWNRAYILSAGGGCLVVGDQLYFYFCGFSGKSPKLGSDLYAGGSTGLATLRRDGFCSLDADAAAGTITTRKVRFQGRHLFVNLEAPRGQLRAEVLDESGAVIAPFSLAQCVPVSGDHTRVRVVWKDSAHLGRVAGRPVRFRFQLRDARLYAFWVSGDEAGSSGGYVAAGGPEFSGPRDSIA